MWQNITLVALGGAAGSVARYLTVLGAGRLAPGFPWGVMAANVAGSFAIGVLAAGAASRPWLPPLLIVGFLGGYTTFSSFSLDALRLWDSAPAQAVGYVLGSVGLSLLAVAAGALAARGWA